MPTKTQTAVTGNFDLKKLVPEAWKATTYINRTIAGERDVDILARARRMQINTILSGPTGPGKSICVEAYCAENGIPLYPIPCNQSLEPKQMFGSWIPTEKPGVYVWQDGPISAMARHPEGGVIMLEEVNFMPSRIGAVLNPLLRERKLTLMDNGGEVIEVGENFQVIAAFNPDYEGTRPLNESFLNRFALKLRFDYDKKIEGKLIQLQSLQNLAWKLRDQHGRAIETPVSTNMLMEFEDIAFEFSLEFAIENFLNAFSNEERASVREVLLLHDAELKTEWDSYLKAGV